MSYPRKYPTVDGMCAPADWNAMVDAANGMDLSGYVLQYPFSYIVRNVGGVYDAVDDNGVQAYGGSGDAGGIDGDDAMAVANAAIANGGRILFRKGTYPTGTSHINIVVSDTEIVGEPGAILQVTDTHTGDTGVIHRAAGADISNITIRGLEIDGNKTGLGGVAKAALDILWEHGIRLLDCLNVRVEDCYIHDFYNGIGINIDAGCSDSVITGNRIATMGTRTPDFKTAAGIYIGATGLRATVSNNVITDCSDTAINVSTGTGVVVEGNIIKKATIAGGSSEGYGTGIDFVDCQRCSAADNYIQGGSYGISLTQSAGTVSYINVENNNIYQSTVGVVTVITATQADHLNIIGNTIIGCGLTNEATGGNGIVFNAASKCIINNNIIHDCAGDGLMGTIPAAAQVSTNSQICGNIITDCDGDGMQIWGLTDGLLSGNVVEGNGDNGVKLLLADDWIITHNTIKNNDKDAGGLNGLTLIGGVDYPCNNNIIMFNKLIDDDTTSQDYGIYIGSKCASNIVHYNDFTGNSQADKRYDAGDGNDFQWNTSDTNRSFYEPVFKVWRADAYGWSWNFYKSRGTAATPVTVDVNDYMGLLTWYGYDGTDWRQAGYMGIKAAALANNRVGGWFVVYVTDSGSGSIEGLRVQGEDGYVVNPTSDFKCETAGKGIILTNSGNTQTKRIKLNDAGNGIDVEAV